MSTLPVSVVVVSFNTKDLTRNALRAVYGSQTLPEQVIVVDNNSSDGTAQMIRNDFPEVVLIENKENLGFAKANNIAIKDVARQPFIWLLNSDTETGRQTLGQLVSYMQAHPTIGVLGPQMKYPDGSLQSVGGFFPSIQNVLYYLLPIVVLLPRRWRARLHSMALFPQQIPEQGLDVDYVTGAAALVRREAIDQAGALSEDYFMYFEETDMCWRMKKNGWTIRVIDTEPVMHVYGGSFASKYDKRRLALFQESLTIFVRKNLSGFSKRVILWEVFLLGSISMFLKKIKK